ncbi:hypothetical protein FOXB_17706 [Fusarium oxysporum f. sp. conglutinans Fo5176]|uniref:Uncharacterized protein n=1 Tax=Fusarium oxysporum (strain Fo5176) TaxID=660025 RepID=F9GGC2_FUSOF|nr:hypothetical protein FOXB_17706 [Fusarium oxysporum f. sp. conglutinans Fo5176]
MGVLQLPYRSLTALLWARILRSYYSQIIFKGQKIGL